MVINSNSRKNPFLDLEFKEAICVHQFPPSVIDNLGVFEWNPDQ